MINTEILRDLSNKIRGIVESPPIGDVEKNINALIRGAFTKMELVSREEFDVQTTVLENTQKQLERCQERLVELEALLKEKT